VQRLIGWDETTQEYRVWRSFLEFDTGDTLEEATEIVSATLKLHLCSRTSLVGTRRGLLVYYHPYAVPLCGAAAPATFLEMSGSELTRAGEYNDLWESGLSPPDEVAVTFSDLSLINHAPDGYTRLGLQAEWDNDEIFPSNFPLVGFFTQPDLPYQDQEALGETGGIAIAAATPAEDWTDPGLATISAPGYAIYNPRPTRTAQLVTSLAPDIPDTAVPLGAFVELRLNQQTTFPGDQATCRVFVRKGSNYKLGSGVDLDTGWPVGSWEWKSAGSPTELFGYLDQLTGADLSAGDFGFTFEFTGTDFSFLQTIWIDGIRVTLYYEVPTTGVTAAPVLSVTYKYIPEGS
jgi:hypothetical protein